MAMLKLGRYLSQGAYKRCYSLGKGKVAVIGNYNQVKKDFALLKKLKKLKIPVVDAELKYVYDNYNKRRLAIVMPRYTCTVRTGSIRLGRDEYCGATFNKEHGKQLKKIYDGIKKKKIFMFDMQFLVKSKPAEIVLSDPGGVEKVRSDSFYNYNLTEIKNALHRLGIKCD